MGVSYDSPPGGTAPMVTDSVVQAESTPLDSGGDSIATVAAALARDVTTWHGLTGRPTAGAILWLRVVLFAVVDGARLPLVLLERVEIKVPPRVVDSLKTFAYKDTEARRKHLSPGLRVSV